MKKPVFPDNFYIATGTSTPPKFGIMEYLFLGAVIFTTSASVITLILTALKLWGEK